MNSDVPLGEVVEMKDELDRIKELLEGAKYHLARYEHRRAAMVVGEIERRERDLDIQLSYWEEKDE